MSRREHLSFERELEEANSAALPEIVTPAYDASAVPSGSLGDDEDEYDEEAENEHYSRSRSRSRSFNEHDTNVPIDLLINVDPSKVPVVPVSGGGGGGGEFPPAPPITERSGPLQQREVLALKKGLEEATPHRNRDELIEEEEEKRAAESEKKKRSLTQQTNQDLTGTGMETQMRRVKILVLGDSGVGKSSLIMRWTADTFSANIVGTVGVNFKTKRVMVNKEFIQVQVWDTAGQEHFHKITTSYYRGAHGILLVYDVSDAKTMDNAEYWIKNIKAHASETVKVALIGNKSDLRHSADGVVCTDPKLATGYAEKFGVPYFETSAKEATNVDLAFMGIVDAVINQQNPSAIPVAGGGGAGGLPSAKPAAPSSSSGSSVAAPITQSPDGKHSLSEKAGKLKKGMYETIIRGASSVVNKEKAPKHVGSSPSRHDQKDKEKCTLS